MTNADTNVKVDNSSSRKIIDYFNSIFNTTTDYMYELDYRESGYVIYNRKPNDYLKFKQSTFALEYIFIFAQMHWSHS